jgi:hypothetical protein
VVGHEVEEDADPARVRLGYQPLGVGQGAEQRIHVEVVGDVVPVVAHRRAEDRGQPHGVHAQPGEVVEPLDDARQVADPITVRILERPRVDLVDDTRLPPGCGVAGRVGRELAQLPVPYWTTPVTTP